MSDTFYNIVDTIASLMRYQAGNDDFAADFPRHISEVLRLEIQVIAGLPWVSDDKQRAEWLANRMREDMPYQQRYIASGTIIRAFSAAKQAGYRFDSEGRFR